MDAESYLAIGGQWKINKWLDSGSAAVFSGNELVAGSMLQKNQQIEIDTHPFIPIKKLLKTRLNILMAYSDHPCIGRT
ncbi:MAG: hypothetical protein R2788_14685 [Saprospiraceae bacterium]